MASHLFCGAFVSEGPTQDSPQFRPALAATAGRVGWRELFADAGYDAEHNHTFAREALGVARTVIALNRRSAGRKWPTTSQPHRRAMKRRANREGAGQRWQIESAFSQHKRVLGSSLRARRPGAREREVYLRVLTHNLMLLAS
jgi:Transposase DDE domain